MDGVPSYLVRISCHAIYIYFAVFIYIHLLLFIFLSYIQDTIIYLIVSPLVVVACCVSHGLVSFLVWRCGTSSFGCCCVRVCLPCSRAISLRVMSCHVSRRLVSSLTRSSDVCSVLAPQRVAIGLVTCFGVLYARTAKRLLATGEQKLKSHLQCVGSVLLLVPGLPQPSMPQEQPDILTICPGQPLCSMSATRALSCRLAPWHSLKGLGLSCTLPAIVPISGMHHIVCYYRPAKTLQDAPGVSPQINLERVPRCHTHMHALALTMDLLQEWCSHPSTGFPASSVPVEGGNLWQFILCVGPSVGPFSRAAATYRGRGCGG